MVDTSQAVSALVVAFISGVTYLAYKHPDAYSKLSIGLSIATLMILIVLGAWDLGRRHMYGDIFMLISGVDDRNKAETVMHEGLILDGWRVIYFLAFMCYLLFLGYLPNILGEQKETQNKRDDKDP